MAATRTQVYLSTEQREAIDALRAEDGRTLAEVVRAALDEYLATRRRPTLAEMQRRLDGTLGSMRGLEVPSREEWERFGGERAVEGRDPGAG